MAVNLDAILRVTATANTAGLVGLEGKLLSIQGAGKGVGSAFSAMGSALGGLTGGIAALGVGLSAAGLANFIQGTVDAADNMRDLGIKTGVSVEMLSKFQQAADMSGTNIDDVGKAMTKLARNMSEAAMTGKGPAADALKELGLSATDANGKMVPLDEQMLRIADRLAALPDPQRRVALAMDLMGKSGANMIPMLSGGREEIEKLNASFDQQFADAADTYNDSLARLQATFQRLGVVLANQFLPFLQKTVDGLTDLGIGLRIINLPFAGDKVKEIAAIRQEILNLRDARAQLGNNSLIPSNPDEEQSAIAAAEAARQKAEEIKLQVEQAKAAQEAFNFAIDQSNFSYDLLKGTIQATFQEVELMNELSAAEYDANISINNSAKSILETKMRMTDNEYEKLALAEEIMKLEIANAGFQRKAAEAQIAQEVNIADLKRRQLWTDLRRADAAFAIAKAEGRATQEMANALELAKQAANSADREFIFTKQVAEQKQRAADAAYDAAVFNAKAGLEMAQMAARERERTREQQAREREQRQAEEQKRQAQQLASREVFQPRATGGGGGGSYSAPLAPRPAPYVPAPTGSAPRQSGGSVSFFPPNQSKGRKTGGRSITINTGPILQQPDGSRWASLDDLERGIASAVDQAVGIVASPAGRMAVGGA